MQKVSPYLQITQKAKMYIVINLVNLEAKSISNYTTLLIVLVPQCNKLLVILPQV